MKIGCADIDGHIQLNKALYEKMVAEQKDYQSWLLEQAPEIILKHAYKNMVLEDILIAMEGVNLPANHAEALLAMPLPLTEVYKKFYDMDIGFMDGTYMEALQKGISERAEELAQTRALYWRAPYLHDIAYAAQHGELDQYRASHRANIACMHSIEAALWNNFDGENLYEDTTGEVLSEFGPNRVSFVLSATLQDRGYDPTRFSKENMEWAMTIPTFDDGAHLYDYTVNSNAARLDCFVTLARKTIALMQERTDSEKDQPVRKPSIKERLAGFCVPGQKSTGRSKKEEVR